MQDYILAGYLRVEESINIAYTPGRRELPPFPFSRRTGIERDSVSPVGPPPPAYWPRSARQAVFSKCRMVPSRLSPAGTGGVDVEDGLAAGDGAGSIFLEAV